MEQAPQPQPERPIDVFSLPTTSAGVRMVFGQEYKMPSGLVNNFCHSLFVHKEDVKIDTLQEDKLKIEDFVGVIEGVVIPSSPGLKNIDLNDYLRISPKELAQLSGTKSGLYIDIETLGRYPVFSERTRLGVTASGEEVYRDYGINLVQ